MSTPNMAILILTLLDLGTLLLAYRLDKIMYKASVFVRLETVNSTFFLNGEFDEPVSRFLLSKGGKLLMIICCLITKIVALIR